MGFTAAGNFFAYSFLLGMTLLVFHSDRKLLAYSFLLGVTLLWFIATGNYSQRRFLDSASAPRNDGGGVGLLFFIAAGNYSRIVSYSA